MKYTQLGSTDIQVSYVSYGGIVSAGFMTAIITRKKGRMRRTGMFPGPWNTA